MRVILLDWRFRFSVKERGLHDDGYQISVNVNVKDPGDVIKMEYAICLLFFFGISRFLGPFATSQPQT